MHIDRKDSSPASRPPEATFTGTVTVSGYFERKAPSTLMGATVTFAPGARTPWKVNPLGQTLIVTNGVGWTQSMGGEIVEIRVGDIVWYSPGEGHWDGATPDQGMTCVAINEAKDGSSVEFGDAVTDYEYRKGPSAP